MLLDLDSRGDVSYRYEITFDSPWLICKEKEGRVDVSKDGRRTVRFSIDRSALKEKDEAACKVKIIFDNGQQTESNLLFKAENANMDAPKDTPYLFLERQGYCAIRAEHFSEKKDVDGKGFAIIDYLGREGAAVKAFPPMERYADAKSAPYVKYAMIAEQSGTYRLAMSLLSRNPSVKGGRMRFAVSVNDDAPQDVFAVSGQYYTEWTCKEWGDGVLDHARTVTTEVTLQKGRNDIYVYAGEPGVVLEKLVLYPAEQELPESYFGPEESYWVK